MSFQFRRRGDVREQSPQQEPFFQNTIEQQQYVDPAGYPQMMPPQGYDPRFNNGFAPQQPYPPQHPQQPSFQGNAGNFYGQQQQNPGAQPMVNPGMVNPASAPIYGPQPAQHQPQPGMMRSSNEAYLHPVHASQLSGQKQYSQGFPPAGHPGSGQRTQEELRSLAFWQESQANSGFDDPDSDTETNSPVRLLVAVAGIALIAGLSWFAYKWAKSPSSDTPPLIHAEPGPHKISPDHRGGINIPYQDKLIYDRIGDGATEEPAERLLPPPERPPVMDMQSQQQPMNQETAQQPMYSEAPANQQIAVPGSQPAQQQPAYMVPPQHMQPQQQMMPPQQPAAVPANAPASTNVATQAPQMPVTAENSVKTEEKKEIEPEIISKTKSDSIIKGNYFVQMATVKSETLALKEWKRVQAKYKLKGMKSQIKESETTDGEVVFRLLMGPFDEKVKALKYAVKIEGSKVVHVTE